MLQLLSADKEQNLLSRKDAAMSWLSISYRTILGLLLGSVLVGCVPPPAPEEIARGDYGPWPHAYQDVIKHHMQDTLQDPASAHYDFMRGPRRAWNTYAG